jgi:hypothetical protein
MFEVIGGRDRDFASRCISIVFNLTREERTEEEQIFILVRQ